MFVEVAPFIKTGKTETFHYEIPKKMKWKLRLGKIVSVPLRNQKVLGVVISRSRKAPVAKVKKVENFFSIKLPPYQLKLARWLSEYYFAPLGNCLKLMVPSLPKRTDEEKPVPSSKLKKIPTLTLAQKRISHFILHQRPTLLPQIFLVCDLSGEARWPLYFDLIKKILKEGKQILFLVPEKEEAKRIYQKLLLYFSQRLILLSTEPSKRQKGLIFKKLKKKRPALIVGSRSSLFYPYKNLALIIVEDENSSAYKEERRPRYWTQKVALKLGELMAAKVILASTSPSFESYFSSQMGEYKLLEVGRKATFKQPKIKLIDLRKEKSKRVISKILEEKMRDFLGEKKKILLFVPRRGFGAIICQDCQNLLRCPGCKIPLTSHLNHQKKMILLCHFCRKKFSSPKLCPHCQSHRLNYFGAGSQSLGEEAKNLFKGARILRVDSDVLGNKSRQIKIKRRIKRGQFDIIVGTKAVFSHLPFRKINLLALIFADFDLNFPDHRVEEALFGQILNLAYRFLERKRGLIYLQTYKPKASLWEFAKNYNFSSFYKKEIKARKELSYPPFSRLLKLIYTCPKEERAFGEAKKLKENLPKDLTLLGPTPCLLPRRVKVSLPRRVKAGYPHSLYGCQLTIKLRKNKDTSEVASIIRNLPKGWVVDADPLNLL